MSVRVRELAAVAALCAGASVLAQAQPVDGQLDVQLSVEDSSGRYREATRTRIQQATLVTRYRRDVWLAEVQLPLVSLRSAGGTAALPDTVGGSAAGSGSERGLGDVWFKLGRELRPATASQTGLDLALKLKTKTGSLQRGLGSGGQDVALQAEFLRPLGPVTAFGQVGWRHTGDVAGATPYRNPWYGEVGALGALSPQLELGGFVSGREPMGRLGKLVDATAYTAWKLGLHRAQLYASHGLSDAAADWSLGLSWRVRY